MAIGRGKRINGHGGTPRRGMRSLRSRRPGRWKRGMRGGGCGKKSQQEMVDPVSATVQNCVDTGTPATLRVRTE